MVVPTWEWSHVNKFTGKDIAAIINNPSPYDYFSVGLYLTDTIIKCVNLISNNQHEGRTFLGSIVLIGIVYTVYWSSGRLFSTPYTVT